MWRDSLFADMAAASREHATFGTFTAAGRVRRALAAAGFEVVRTPGFGRKRECLRGRLRDAAAQRPQQYTPWDLRDQADPPPTSALVIGAGLAGAHCAEALARRGIPVTVLEAAQPAGAASGNPQGILFTRLSPRHSALSDFGLQAFAFASRRYRALDTPSR